MVCDLGIGLARSIETADCFRDDAMQSAALGRRQRVVERLANQRMAKAVASRRAADLVDEFKRSGLIEKFGHGLARHPACGFEAVEVEIASDDRGDIENVASVFGQRLDQALDELDDAARNRQPGRHARRVARELPLRRHLPKNLVQKERVAFCHIVQPADQ